MTPKWKTINSKVVYKNKWISVIQDDVIKPDGKKGLYGYLAKPNAIFIVAEDKDGSLFFIKEYRYVVKKVIMQMPSGVMENDDFKREAIRELKEETGIIAKDIKYLGEFYIAPGHETTKVIAVLATNLDVSHLSTVGQEGDESIVEICKMNIKKVKDYLSKGKIECGITTAVLNLYFLDRKI